MYCYILLYSNKLIIAIFKRCNCTSIYRRIIQSSPGSASAFLIQRLSKLGRWVHVRSTVRLCNWKVSSIDNSQKWADLNLRLKQQIQPHSQLSYCGFSTSENGPGSCHFPSSPKTLQLIYSNPRHGPSSKSKQLQSKTPRNTNMRIFLQSTEIHGANGRIYYGKLIICVRPTSLEPVWKTFDPTNRHRYTRSSIRAARRDSGRGQHTQYPTACRC